MLDKPWPDRPGLGGRNRQAEASQSTEPCPPNGHVIVHHTGTEGHTEGDGVPVQRPTPFPTIDFDKLREEIYAATAINLTELRDADGVPTGAVPDVMTYPVTYSAEEGWKAGGVPIGQPGDEGFAVYDETLGQYKALDLADVLRAAGDEERLAAGTHYIGMDGKVYPKPEPEKTIGEKRQDELHAISHAVEVARKLEQVHDLLIYGSLVPNVVNENRVEFLVVKDDHEFHKGTGMGQAIGASMFSLASGIMNEAETAADRLLCEARDSINQLLKGD